MINRRELLRQYSLGCVGLCLPWANFFVPKRRHLFFYDFTQPDKYTGDKDSGGVGTYKSPDGRCRTITLYCDNIDVGYHCTINEDYNRLNKFADFRYPACVYIYKNKICLIYKDGRKLNLPYSAIQKAPYAPRCPICGYTEPHSCTTTNIKG